MSTASSTTPGSNPAAATPPYRVANLFGGAPAGASTGASIEVIDPSTASVCGTLPDSDAADVERAVDAATRAFPAWSRTSAEDRCRLMLALADRVEASLEELALLESIDSGKPLHVARTVDIPRAVKNLRFFATATMHSSSEAHETDGEALNVTLRRPRGVAGVISPWNLPLYLFTWKVAPALATGNTVVGKPSELTPLTAWRLGELATEAGFPPGVLNIVHGRGAETGAALVAHPGVPTISFTGGTVTGASIAATAGPMFKRVALELGGKNPTIVFDDAGFEEAVAVGVRSAFANQGEICLCGSRVFVQRGIVDRFTDAFVGRARRLEVGDPLDAETDIGALVSREHLARVESYVEMARNEGGDILCGGTRPASLSERCRNGFFLEPTVVTGLDAGCRTNQEEIFGPVASIIPFDTTEEVVRLANSTPYGLSASVWTRDLDRAHHVAASLDAGTVWVNCWLLRDLRVPFGGMKQSGLGREGGREAMRFFTEPKNVCIRVRPPGDETP